MQTWLSPETTTFSSHCLDDGSQRPRSRSVQCSPCLSPPLSSSGLEYDPDRRSPAIDTRLDRSPNRFETCGDLLGLNWHYNYYIYIYSFSDLQMSKHFVITVRQKWCVTYFIKIFIFARMVLFKIFQFYNISVVSDYWTFFGLFSDAPISNRCARVVTN